MWLKLCAGRSIVVLAIVSFCGAVLVGQAAAQTIDLSLNVFYTNPLDDLSGGTWQVVAKSADSAGIAGLDLKLAGIVEPPTQAVGPRGTVNGSNPAGFSVFAAVDLTDYVNIVVGQQPISVLPPGDEQSIFYGVGTIMDGQPGDVGPVLATLSNPQAIPWATGDPFFDEEWNTAALLAAGTFVSGQSPSFYTEAPNPTSGRVFTAVGTSTSVGPQMNISVSTIVRENLGGSPDYNENGVVDAADYSVWRDALGQMGPGLVADGNLNGVVDLADYEFWVLNFGLVIGPGAGSGGLNGGSGGEPLFGPAVPEPASGTLLVGVLGILFLRPGFRHLRNKRLS